MSKLLVIGLDCLEPSLVEAWLDDLPTFAALMENGAWGRLRSSHPPITVPAWASMLSGRDPGELGIYGFRNRWPRLPRSQHRYQPRRHRRGCGITQPRRTSARSSGVPQTWPLKPVPGVLQVSSFTPPARTTPIRPSSRTRSRPSWRGGGTSRCSSRRWAHANRRGQAQPAPHLRDRHPQLPHRGQSPAPGRYLPHDREALARGQPPDPAQTVGFLHAGGDGHRPHPPRLLAVHDPEHVHYPGPHNQFERFIHDYYVYLDGQIARLLEQVNEETMLMVVSDHGRGAWTVAW
ncbi:MAG: alkaline phosphatase family protein [Caldilineaceae bacterium]